MLSIKSKNFKIIVLLMMTCTFISCGPVNDNNSDNTNPKKVSTELNTSDLRDLCFEGAYRNGKHCNMDRHSSELGKICHVMTTGSGSCNGFSSLDLTNTCKAALYGKDYCDQIKNQKLKNACKAAAYGSDRFCD